MFALIGVSLLLHVFSLAMSATLLSGWRCAHHPAHAAVEMAGAVIAMIVAHLLMQLDHRGEGTSFNLAIAGALVGMGVLDGLHAVVHEGNTFVFLHSFATFAGGLLFALVWLPVFQKSDRLDWWPWVVLCCAGTVGLLSMAEPGLLPVMVRDGVFTPMAGFLNVAGGLLMFASALRFVLTYRRTQRNDDLLFCLHCALFGLAALMFEQSALWDFAWWGWHVLRLLAYGAALWFLIRSNHRATERVLEITRQQGETRYRNLFENSHDAMMVFEGAGFSSGNPAALQMFGFQTVQEFCQTGPVELSPLTQPCGTDSRRLAEQHIARAVREGTHFFEWRHCRSDGSQFDSEVRLSAIPGGSGPMVQGIVRDVSDRKSVERRLAEAAEKTRAILNSTSDGIITFDETGVIESANPAACVIFGYSEKELLSRNVSWLIPTLSYEENARHLVAFSLTGKNRDNGNGREVTGVCSDGTEFPLELQVTRVDLPDRQLYTGSVRDITGRVAAERALRESDARFQLLATHLDDILWLTSSDGSEIIFVSSAYERIWGRTCESLYERPDDWTGGLHPADRERVAEAFYKGAALGTFDETYRVLRPDGSMSWVHATGYPVVDESGEVHRIAGVVRDISKEVAAESRLKQSLERIQTLLDTAHDAFVSIDFDSRVIEWNRQSEVTFGYTRDEAMGRRLTELIISPEHREAHLKGLSMFREAERGAVLNRRIELPAVDRDGRQFPVEMTIWPLCHDGRFSFNAFIHDITERQETEQALLAAKEASEEANRAKSDFLASMSHELRTPLNGVIGMTELLAGTDLNSKQQRFVDACRVSGESLLDLINDVLDFSKIEAGRLELDFREFDVDELVSETVTTMALRLIDKDVELTCFVDVPSGTILTGDSSRLRQVLVNLMGNAAKFTEHGEISVRVTVVDQQPNHARLRFAVTDSGIGIPQDKLERLFEKFTQVDQSTSRRYGGTGLGLSISKELVVLMDGTIGADSEPSVGSTFWFEIPFNAQTCDPARANVEQLSGMNVLIVDDSATNREILSGYAEEWRMQATVVDSVATARQALSSANALGTPFDFVLTDYCMPDEDGLQLARNLTGRSERVILLQSADDLDLEPDKITAAGIDATLRKPLRKSELRQVLISALDTHPVRVAEEECHVEGTPSVATAGHVLLAEDNSINRMYLVELLNQINWTCDTVTNGREAVEAVLGGSHKYDMVFMDCQMPELDGFEASQRIRELEAEGQIEGHIPIVALTANVVAGDRERCLAAGMDHYLAKPAQLHEVLDLLDQMLQSGEMPSNNAGERPAPLTGETSPLASHIEDNLELVESLLTELEGSSAQQIKDIRQAIKKHQPDAVVSAARRLRVTAVAAGKASTVQITRHMEEAARSLDFDKINTLINHFIIELHHGLHGISVPREPVSGVKGTGY